MKFLTVYIEVISCMHYSCVVGHSDSRWPAKCAVKMFACEHAAYMEAL